MSKLNAETNIDVTKVLTLDEALKSLKIANSESEAFIIQKESELKQIVEEKNSAIQKLKADERKVREKLKKQFKQDIDIIRKNSPSIEGSAEKILAHYFGSRLIDSPQLKKPFIELERAIKRESITPIPILIGLVEKIYCDDRDFTHFQTSLVIIESKNKKLFSSVVQPREAVAHAFCSGTVSVNDSKLFLHGSEVSINKQFNHEFREMDFKCSERFVICQSTLAVNGPIHSFGAYGYSDHEENIFLERPEKKIRVLVGWDALYEHVKQIKSPEAKQVVIENLFKLFKKQNIHDFAHINNPLARVLQHHVLQKRLVEEI